MFEIRQIILIFQSMKRAVSSDAIYWIEGLSPEDG